GRSDTLAEGGDAAVVAEPAAVEDHAGDAGGLGPVSDELARRLGGVDGGRRAVAQALVRRGGGGQGATGRVVDELGVDVPVGPEHGQPRPLGGTADLLPDPAMPLGPRLCATDTHRFLPWFSGGSSGGGAPRVPTSSRPCRPCAGRARRRTGRPWPCRTRA